MSFSFDDINAVAVANARCVGDSPEAVAERARLKEEAREYGELPYTLIGEPQRELTIPEGLSITEQIKLFALGISKSFLEGETSYSSAAVGLDVLMRKRDS